MYVDLNNMINKVDMNDMYRILYPTTAEFMFFPNVHNKAFKKINHMLYHNVNLNILQS